MRANRSSAERTVRGDSARSSDEKRQRTRRDALIADHLQQQILRARITRGDLDGGQNGAPRLRLVAQRQIALGQIGMRAAGSSEPEAMAARNSRAAVARRRPPSSAAQAAE